jgi:cystathionine beta-lyase/cystathionine gamma-synthase
MRDYLDAQVRRADDLRAAEQKRTDDLRAADKEAVRTTKDAMEKRLEGLNELRTGVATSAEMSAISDATRRVERLVYIGMGLAIAMSVGIPLLLAR